jgi:hypothetical protein
MSIKKGDACPTPDCDGTIVEKKGPVWEMKARPGYTDSGTRTRYQTWRCSNEHDVDEELK